MKKIVLIFMFLLVAIVVVSCKKTPENTQKTPYINTPSTSASSTEQLLYASDEPIIPAETEVIEATESTTSIKSEDNILPMFVSYETGILDKTTDIIDINEVTQFINDKNDMDSFTNKFNVKYYKIIGKDRCIRYRHFGIEIEKPGYFTQVIATSGYETIVKTNNGYLFVRYFFGEKIIAEDYNIISRGEQAFFAYCEPIIFSSDNAKEKIGTLDLGAFYWDVVNIDPDGKYDISKSFGAPYLNYSYHYFTDGTGYEIKYDEKYYVEEITKISV